MRLRAVGLILSTYRLRSLPVLRLASTVTSPVRMSLRSRKPSQFWLVGLPTISNTRPSCSISVLPVNRGLPRMSSARMQPADQMSTEAP